MPPAGKPDLSGYNYGAIASLVLTPDRSNIPRGDKEPDGAPTSLAGRIDPKQMGSRVLRQTPKDLDKKKKKATEGRDVSDRQPSKRRVAETGFGHTDITPVAAALAAIGYEGYLSAEALPFPDGNQAAAQTLASYRKFFTKS